jgi:hypothetical protein
MRCVSRALLSVLSCVCLFTGWTLALPALAGAEATAGPAPMPGPSGLPDGRIYEEVSPANKNGNFVASGGGRALVQGSGYGVAAADGNALVFLGSGAMGEASSSTLQPFVARRTPGVGWWTSSVAPDQVGVASPFGGPSGLLSSEDFSRFAFTSIRAYSPEQPLGPEAMNQFGVSGSVNIFFTENSLVPPAWLGKPAIANAVPEPGEDPETRDYLLAGGTPSLSAVYFTYAGTLITQDASRTPNVGNGMGQPETAPWGFYEWSNGTLSAAGVLPNGSVSAFGAVPASVAGDSSSERSQTWHSENFDNQVSLDGARVFFVSPDPVASTVSDKGGCEGHGPCTSAPPELYVREALGDGSRRTVLVSQSQLPGHVGEPAPTGPVPVASAAIGPSGESLGDSDAYASADGSRVFFATRDRLTAQAPENTEVKEYEFEVSSESLSYLPGVTGPIVAVAQDGSDFLFENRSSRPWELDLWRAGSGGGQVTEVVQLPKPVEPEEPEPYFGEIGVEGRMSADGSVFVFDTNAPVPGGFNNGAGYGEVYRYDATANELSCVSCPGAGVDVEGNATISYDNGGGGDSVPRSTQGTRAMSADGSRVFFDTPSPLLPQASNGLRNVYEWENGKVYLISSGTSDENSYYLDNSESGGDVFFGTTSGLVAGDTDGAYDAYDARVPRPGDNPPPTAVPCEGDVCQGPPSVPQLLAAPASAAFSGAGNVASEKPAVSTPAPRHVKKARRQPKHRSKARARKRRRSRRGRGGSGNASRGARHAEHGKRGGHR